MTKEDVDNANGPFSIEFAIRNRTRDAISFGKPQPSCGCILGIEGLDTPLSRRESRIIKVLLTAPLAGSRSESIRIPTSSPEIPVLQFQVEVSIDGGFPKIVHKPHWINLHGVQTAAARKSFIIETYEKEDTEPAIRSAVCSLKEFGVHLVDYNEAETRIPQVWRRMYRFEIVAPEELPKESHLFGFVEILNEYGETVAPVGRIPVYSSFIKGYCVAPGHILVGSSGEAKQWTVNVIDNSDNCDVRVESVTCESPWLRATDVRNRGRVAQIEIGTDGNIPTGPWKTSVRIDIASDRRESIDLPVTAVASSRRD